MIVRVLAIDGQPGDGGQVDTITQLVTIAAVLLGSLTTYVTNQLVERSKHKQSLRVRWDENKLDAYVEYVGRVRPKISPAVRRTGRCNTPGCYSPSIEACTSHLPPVTAIIPGQRWSSDSCDTRQAGPNCHSVVPLDAEARRSSARTIIRKILGSPFRIRRSDQTVLAVDAGK